MNALNKLVEKPSLGDLLCVEITSAYDYADGKPTGEPVGYKYHCVAPSLNFVAVTVKVVGKQQIDELTQPVKVQFTNLRGTPYVNSANRPDISFRADTVHVIKGNTP